MAKKIRIFADEPPSVELHAPDGEVYELVYTFSAMEKLSAMSKEGSIPADSMFWDRTVLIPMLETTGYAHHPEVNWNKILDGFAPTSIIDLSNAIAMLVKHMEIPDDLLEEDTSDVPLEG